MSDVGDKLQAPPEQSRPPPRSTRDQERHARLRRNRMYATGLLALMGTIYFSTYAVTDPGYAILMIRSGAEGGTVGGLADWFAITALFRRPMGLPIPHTAIVPRSKERIGNALGRFIEENFLTREVLLRRLRHAQFGHRAVAWLAAPATSPAVSGWIVRSLPQLLRALDSPELQAFARRTIGEQMSRADTAPIIGRLIQAMATSGEADRLFDSATEAAAGWLEEHREDVYRLVSERNRWWVPKAINRRIAAAIIDGLTDVLGQLREPDSSARQQFRDALQSLVDDLIRSPERRAEVDAAKRRLLAHPDVQNWLGSLWRNALAGALRDLEQPTPRAQGMIENLLQAVARALAADETALARIEAAIERVALTVVLRRAEIGGIVADIVRSWDERSMTTRLELAIGSDLQYIRMNGTLVGAGVGALLFVVVHLLELAG